MKRRRMNKEKLLQLKKTLHPMKPVVLIGQKGLTDAVLIEIDVALKAHECIKLKFSGWDKSDKEQMRIDICEKLKAEFIQSIGHTLVIYRKKNG
jgi:RNA-binding protein